MACNVGLLIVFINFIVITLFLYTTIISFSPTELKINTNKVEKRLPDLTISCVKGRLGNNLFRLAILYGLSKLNNRRPVVPTCVMKGLDKIFDTSFFESRDLPPEEQWKTYQLGRQLNISSDLDIPLDVNVITGPPVASYTFFREIQSEIKSKFRFNENTQSYVRITLDQIRGDRKNTIFVGVHVRRTDFLLKLKYYNRLEAPKSYFDKAFRYYRHRYRDCIFVICSDDIDWCKANFYSDVFDDTYFHEGSSDMDFALLSNCNHSIIDYGTFSFWCAFLAGGETIYFANSTAPGTWFHKKNPVDEIFFLPEWTGISIVTPKFWRNFPVFLELPELL